MVTGVMGACKMSNRFKVKLWDTYIPFEKVLKSNFVLQELVSQLTMELQKAQEKLNQDEHIILELRSIIS